MFAVAFTLANFQAIQTTTIYLHRGKTHSAVILSAWFQAVSKFLLWIHTSIIVKEWVGVHRHHHAHADKEEDPHSPWVFGFTKVQFWNVVLYGKATKDTAMIERHTRDIPYTRFDKLFFRRPWLGLGLGGALYYLALGVPGVIGFIASGLCYVFLQSSTINGLGHYPSKIGRRNYEDAYAARSYNLHLPGALQYLLTWYLGGEENHNNHHGDPGSAFFAHFPEKGEKDAAAVVIRFLLFCRIAQKAQRPRVWKIAV